MAGRFCRASYGDGGYIVGNVSADAACSLHGFPQPATARIQLSIRLRGGSQTGAYGLGFGWSAEDGHYMRIWADAV